MPTLHVQPRQTPAERPGHDLELEVDERLVVGAATIEDWVTPRGSWDFTLREGHDFGRTNNVEGTLMLVDGNQTSSVSFRLDQLDVAEAMQDELLLRFEERDGIAKRARCTENGLDVELFHIVGFE
jgi:hypothetical protein